MSCPAMIERGIRAGLAGSLTLNAFRLRVSFSLVPSLGSRGAALIVLPLVRRSLELGTFPFCAHLTLVSSKMPISKRMLACVMVSAVLY